MACNNANVNNVQVNGGRIKLQDTSGVGDEFQISSDNYILRAGSSMFSLNDSINDEKFIGMDISESSEPTIQISTSGRTRTQITGSEIRTPKLTQTSLESIKKNISLYNNNALKTILNSDIYIYNLKSEKDTDNKHIGFVIGDKYRTPKEVINKEGNAIELYSAIGILWKGMQEQQKKIEELENKIKEK